MVMYRAVKIQYYGITARSEAKQAMPESWLMQHKQPRHFNLNVRVKPHFLMMFLISMARSLSSRKMIQKVIKLKTSCIAKRKGNMFPRMATKYDES